MLLLGRTWGWVRRSEQIGRGKGGYQRAKDVDCERDNAREMNYDKMMDSMLGRLKRYPEKEGNNIPRVSNLRFRSISLYYVLRYAPTPIARHILTPFQRTPSKCSISVRSNFFGFLLYTVAAGEDFLFTRKFIKIQSPPSFFYTPFSTGITFH